MSNKDKGNGVGSLLQRIHVFATVEKFDKTVGIQALSSLSAEDTFRAAANLLQNLTDPETAFSDEENASPMQRAFNSNVSYWAMIEKPGEENRRRFRRMNAAMEGSARTQPPKVILQCKYPFLKLIHASCSD